MPRFRFINDALLAGHDTAASTLACLLVELAQSASWQETVRQELRQVLEGRPPTAPDIPPTGLDRSGDEGGMRPYPAAHSIGRTTVRGRTARLRRHAAHAECGAAW